MIENEFLEKEVNKLFNQRFNFYKELFLSHKETIYNSSKLIADSIKSCSFNKGKVILFGNGGSNAQSSHLATELLIRFKADSKRNPIPAIAISADPSVITAAGNDYDFDEIFQRQLTSLASKNDCIIAFSTSGKSKNILNGIKEAAKIIQSKKNIFLITGNKFDEKEDLDFTLIKTPILANTEIYQEYHLLLIHMLCNILEIYSIKY